MLEQFETYSIQSTPEQREHQLDQWYTQLQEKQSESILDTSTQDVNTYEWQGVTYD